MLVLAMRGTPSTFLYFLVFYLLGALAFLPEGRVLVGGTVALFLFVGQYSVPSEEDMLIRIILDLRLIATECGGCFFIHIKESTVVTLAFMMLCVDESAHGLFIL